RTLPPPDRNLPMRSRRLSMNRFQTLLPGWLAVVFVTAVHAGAAEPAVDFTRDIRPILSNNCFYCHGPDSGQRKGGTDGLRFDTPNGMLADLGDGHQAVVPGQPEKSVLMRRVRSTNPDEVMPPRSTGKKLMPREI